MNNLNSDTNNYECIRRRWDSEDNLLLSRTGIFLTANSILCAASQLQDNKTFQIGIAVISLTISFFWLTTSWHSFNIIATLFRKAKDCFPEHETAIFRIHPIFLRPNTVFGKYLPSVIVVAWIAYLFWCLRDNSFWWLLSIIPLVIFIYFIIKAYSSSKKLRDRT
jgi:hypothetical protein